MAENTLIEWADATLNYVNGCTRVSPGCGGPGPHGGCYAERLAGTRLRNHPSRVGLTKQTAAGPRWTGEVRAHEPALLQALAWKRPRRIFWNAHGDLFHENVPDEWIDRLFAVCALTPQHTHMILTKRSARMREYLSIRAGDWQIIWPEHADPSWMKDKPVRPVDFPLPNVFLGVSVEDQQRADERIPDLLATPAAVRFLSCEPLLGPVDLTMIQFPNERGGMECWDALDLHSIEGEALLEGNCDATLDWVIVGGESGPNARPMHPDWARALRDQCQEAAVPFFFKQWGDLLPGEIFHPESEQGAGDVHWQDGSKEYNGEHIDFDTRTIAIHVPPGCPVAAEEARQTAEKGWIDGNSAGRRAATCARPACRAAARFCKGDDKPWITVAHRVGKKRAGRLLDGRTWEEFPHA